MEFEMTAPSAPAKADPNGVSCGLDILLLHEERVKGSSRLVWKYRPDKALGQLLAEAPVLAGCQLIVSGKCSTVEVMARAHCINIVCKAEAEGTK